MSAPDTKKRNKPSASARAEAAAWIARLHGPNRDANVEEACRRWIADDPKRAAAFELLTDTWDKSGQLPKRPIEEVSNRELRGFHLSLPRALLATCAIAVIAVGITVLCLRTDGVSTVVGEQRTLTLQDGSRVYLNTNSRAVVRFDRQARRVELEKGEALFEVAKNSALPFIVTAGDRQVRALGTAFVVRRDPQRLAITLVEGKVAVSGDSTQETARLLAASERTPGSTGPGAAAADVFTLDPGQRVTFASGQPPKVDRPRLEKVTAWQHGQVSLDNTTLADAVSEMNRYNRMQLVVDDPQVATIRISGVFRAGDTENFVQALVRTYHLQVKDRGSDVVAVGPPAT
jgi:transmembrane sensor